MVNVLSILSDDSGRAINSLFERDVREPDQTREVRWLGTGPEIMGFGPHAQRPMLQNLILGRAVSGSKNLVFDFVAERPVVGWQIEITAPKSFSVLWALSSAPERAELGAIHQKGVEATLQQVEQHAISEEGPDIRGIFFAATKRTVTELGDPHLKAQCLMLNLQTDALGRLAPIGQSPLAKSASHAARCYALTVTSEIDRRFGWAKLERSHGEFQLSGISEVLRREFSRKPQKTGFRGFDAPPRACEARGEELFAVWRRRAALHGWREHHTEALVRGMAYRSFGRAVGHGVEQLRRAVSQTFTKQSQGHSH